MLVIGFKILLVGMRVRVGLPVMAVLVLMLDVLMLVQGVRVGMRHLSVRVLMSVLRGHCCPISGRICSTRSPSICK